MPIPSRPIPTPAPRRAPTTNPSTASASHSASASGSSTPTSGKRGPGTSLPRPRCGLTYIDYTEGIYDLPLPSSAPVKGLSGVRVVSAKILPRVQEPKRMEVGVEGLVLDGLGKREKRSTTATSLGFDFIPNPSIVALPDDQPNPKSSLSPNNSSFRGSSSHSHTPSPATPALVPTTVNEQEVEDEDGDEDDDWEHISRTGEQEQEQERERDNEDEGDMIFLGELELEDRVDVDTTKGKHVVVKGGKSYAAAAGSTVKV